MTEVPPRVLTGEQCSFYREHGWLLVERLIPDAWLERLRDAVDSIVEDSRSMSESSPAVELWRDHSRQRPSLYHVDSPDDMQPAIWEFASTSSLVDAACDLLGSRVRYRYGALRFRKLGPTDLWHQDMPFDALEGRAVLAGVHLHDTGPRHPRLQVISGSHRGETFSHLDPAGSFIGELNADEMRRVDAGRAVDLTAPAGSVEFLDYRTLHQDMYGGESEGGALLYAAYAAADAVPIGEARYPAVPSSGKGRLLGAQVGGPL